MMSTEVCVWRIRSPGSGAKIEIVRPRASSETIAASA